MKDYAAKKLKHKMATKRKSIFDVINNMSRAEYFIATVTLVGWTYYIVSTSCVYVSGG